MFILCTHIKTKKDHSEYVFYTVSFLQLLYRETCRCSPEESFIFSILSAYSFSLVCLFWHISEHCHTEKVKRGLSMQHLNETIDSKPPNLVTQVRYLHSHSL